MGVGDVFAYEEMASSEVSEKKLLTAFLDKKKLLTSLYN